MSNHQTGVRGESRHVVSRDGLAGRTFGRQSCQSLDKGRYGNGSLLQTAEGQQGSKQEPVDAVDERDHADFNDFVLSGIQTGGLQIHEQISAQSFSPRVCGSEGKDAGV